MAGPSYNQGISKKNEPTVIGVHGGGNLTSGGYESSTSGYSATGKNNAPKYNQGISGGTTTNKNGQRSLSGSGSGSGSGGSSGGYPGSVDYSGLLGAYGSMRSNYDEYLAQMRAAAEAAYERGMSALNSAYDSQMSSLSDNLSETKNQLLNSYNRSKTNISDDAENSLRQAYINKMLSERNIGQQMSALGLSGGATESTLASLLNKYSGARNDINTTANKNYTQLEGNYNDSLSQAMQAYNSAVANANLQKAQQIMQLENALANNQISALGNYYSLLQSDNDRYLDLLKTAVQKGASFNLTPTAATNAMQGVSTQQAAPLASNSNYTAALQALANASNAANKNTITVDNPNLNYNYLAAIQSQLNK